MSMRRHLPPSLRRLETRARPPLRVMGIDLGQANDYTAITTCEPPPGDRPTYPIGWIERIPLNVPYPKQVAHIAKLASMMYAPVAEPVPAAGMYAPSIMAPPELLPEVVIVLDYTGVGRPVVDMVLEARANGAIPEDVKIVPVTITGGARVNWDEYGVHIPKRDLASVTQVVLQETRLHIPQELQWSTIMASELQGFRVKIGITGRETYGAGEDWRSAPHDDLVMSLALTLWYCEHRPEVSIS